MRRIPALLLLLLLLPATAVPAQEMAHPGWHGNGIAPELWWKHARFVRFGNGESLPQITKDLNLVSSVGADSILLPPLSAGTAGTVSPLDPKYGTDTDLDTLLVECAARHMHVVLETPLASLSGAEGAGAVRFWMNHGISGFDLGTIANDAASQGSVEQLHAELQRFPGQRILMATVEAAPENVQEPAAPAHRHARAAQSSAVGPIAIHIARLGVSSSPSSGMTAVEVAPASGEGDALASALALLTAPGEPILDAGMLSNQKAMQALQGVLALRAANPAFRSGDATEIPLNAPGATAWLCRPAHPSHATPPMLILLNRTDEKVPVSIEARVRILGVRATFVRPVLRTDGGMGSIDLQDGTIKAHSAVVGELRY